jgi:hypothetical protein
MRYTAGMAGKVTLYVRDDDLWARARQASGPAGLSDLVQQCLRSFLDGGARAASPPSLLERARQLRDDADALVRAVESSPELGSRRQPSKRRRTSR